MLNFSNPTFGEFFSRHGIDIHGPKYLTYGDSKARKLRALWDQEPDELVGKVSDELLDAYEVGCELRDEEADASLLAKGRAITARLMGKRSPPTVASTESEFLRLDLTFPAIEKLPIEAAIAPIVQARLAEVSVVMNAGGYLSGIILCGSVLEAVLLGAATKHPALFNSASSSPKDMTGVVRRFPDWKLSEFINVASEVGLLKPDVKKFSHGLRDFRNYIHPYQQMASGFSPDAHTARVCLQVLLAALASVAGER